MAVAKQWWWQNKLRISLDWNINRITLISCNYKNIVRHCFRCANHGYSLYLETKWNCFEICSFCDAGATSRGTRQTLELSRESITGWVWGCHRSAVCNITNKINALRFLFGSRRYNIQLNLFLVSALSTLYECSTQIIWLSKNQKLKLNRTEHSTSISVIGSVPGCIR